MPLILILYNSSLLPFVHKGQHCPSVVVQLQPYMTEKLEAINWQWSSWSVVFVVSRSSWSLLSVFFVISRSSWSVVLIVVSVVVVSHFFAVTQRSSWSSWSVVVVSCSSWSVVLLARRGQSSRSWMVFIFYGGYAHVFTETYGWGKPRSISGQMYGGG